MPVGIFSSCKQAAAFGTVGVEQLILDASDQMPGRRSGWIELVFSAGPYNDTPA
jgi:hypothetical protein